MIYKVPDRAAPQHANSRTGKRVGGALYIHKDALAARGPESEKVRAAMRAARGADWNVAKIEKTSVSLLDDVLAGAMSSGQYAAARAVIDSKARLKGLFIDRVEIGAADRFRDCETSDEVIDRIIAEAGGAHGLLKQLRELADKIENRAAMTAVDVVGRTRRLETRLLTAQASQKK